MTDSKSDRLAEAVEKLCMILGAHLAHQLPDLDQNVKAARLSAIGFSNEQVAMLLGVKTGAATVAIHRGKKAARKK
jgi:hypothetical protein